jgi:hypothetical protein
MTEIGYALSSENTRRATWCVHAQLPKRRALRLR